MTTTQTEPSELGPYQPMSDAQVLAALDRAQRQNPHGYDRGVIWADLVAHLGFVHVPATTFKLRNQIGRLRASGCIERRKESGCTLWRMTNKGRGQLKQARRRREDLTLPEAPQHRLWREARALAADSIGDLREEVRRTLDEANTALDGGEDNDSGAWFDLCERLGRQLQRFGSAIYCLREWPEPDDAHPDLDRSPRSERHRSFYWDMLRGARQLRVGGGG